MLTYNVSLIVGAGYEILTSPASVVNWGESTSFTIKLETAYSNSGTPVVKVNGTSITGTDNGDGSYTYTVSDIKENKTIVVDPAVKNQYDVTVVKADDAAGIASFTPAAAVSVEHGTGTTITVTLADGYSNSMAPEISYNDATASLSGGVKSIVDEKTVYTYTVSDVTAATTFTIHSADPNTYTVIYQKNDDTEAYATRTVTYDGDWPAAPTFTRVGYTPVDGWFDEEGQPVDMSGKYTTVGDTTVYKHWNIHSSTLTIDLGVLASDPAVSEPSITVDGITFNNTHNFTKSYTSTLDIPDPIREGYTFTGWNKAGVTNGSFVEGTYTYGANETADTLVATWQVETFAVNLTVGNGYTVTHAPESPVNWGGETYVTIELSTGYTNSSAPAATVNGSTLNGTDNGDGTFTYTVSDIKEVKNIVIASAVKNTYNVTFSEASDAVGIYAYTPSVTVEHETGTGTVTVTLEDAFSDSDAPVITLSSGAAQISGGEESTVGGKTVYTYTVSNVTSASSFEIGPANPNKYVVYFDATRVGYTVTQNPPTFVYYEGTAVAKITLATGYSNSAIPAWTVTDGTYAEKTAVKNGNVITYTVTGINANTSIFIDDATKNTYTVDLNVDLPEVAGYEVITNPAATVAYGGSTEVRILLAPAYTNSDFPDITIRNEANEDIGSYVASKVGNVITYTVNDITDNVTITIGHAQRNKYTITINTGLGASIKPVEEGASAYPSPYVINDVDYGTIFTFKLADDSLSTTVYVNSVAWTPDDDGVYTVEVTSNIRITTTDLTYIATFLLDDGVSFYANYIVVRGEDAECYKGDPVKPATDHHEYLFTGWVCSDPGPEYDLTDMTEDRTFVAQFETIHHDLMLAHDETNHWWYCPECGYTEGTEVHAEGPVMVENYVPAMCTVQGSHDEVVYCTVCGYELSRTAVNDGYDYTNHTTTETYYEVLYNATCTTPGMKVFYCKDCDHVVRYEEIPVNPANHCWTAWVDDGDGVHHHRGCVFCGEENMQTRVHSLRELYRIAPTCVSDGEIVSYCPDCATVITETLPATGKHTPSDVYWENYIAPTCVDEGGYDAVIKCTCPDCEFEISRTHVTLEATGIHEYEVTYSVENPTCTQSEPVIATYTCCVCGDTYTEEIPVPGVHTVTNWTETKMPTESDPVGYRTGICDVCGETVTEELYFKPVGQRFMKFIAQDGVTYTVVNYDTHEENVVSGTISYYTNVPMKFFVTVNSSFPYSDYDVYVDGVKISQNADGSYSIPPADSGANIKVVGTIPAAINPGDSGTDQGNNVKISFWQRIINFFKRIFSIFQR